jgi:hypothetical protein
MFLSFLFLPDNSEDFRIGLLKRGHDLPSQPVQQTGMAPASVQVYVLQRG